MTAMFFGSRLSAEEERNILHLVLLIAAVLLGVYGERVFISKDKPGETVPARFDFLTALLFLAVLGGGILRFYGLDFGLPHPYHPDEWQKATFVLRMKARATINPNFSLQPPLLLYLSWGASRIVAFLGFFPDNRMARILLAGRAVNAIAGTISIYLIYLLGKRVSSRLTGVVAALLLAVVPLHVTNSRYMKEDALFVMFVIACAIMVLKSVDQRKPKLLFLTGMLAGLAIGSKYTAVVTVVIILSAPWLVSKRFSFRPDPVFLKHAFWGLLFVPIGFILSAPYVATSVENLHQMLEGFAYESRHAMGGHLGLAIDAWSQFWMYHFSRSVIPGIELLPTICALLGAGIFLKRWESKGLFIVGLVLLFYLPAEWARSKPPPQPDRYVLACVPFLAILAGECISWLSRFRNLQYAKMAVLSLLVLSPLFRSLAYASELRLDTRLQMRRWISQSLPAGSRILTMGGAVYLPRVPNRFQTRSVRKVLGRNDDNLIARLKGSSYDYLLLSSLTPKRFSVEGTGNSALKRALRDIHNNFRLVKQLHPRHGTYGFHNPIVSLYALQKLPYPASSSGY